MSEPTKDPRKAVGSNDLFVEFFPCDEWPEIDNSPGLLRMAKAMVDKMDDPGHPLTFVCYVGGPWDGRVLLMSSDQEDELINRKGYWVSRRRLKTTSFDCFVCKAMHERR